MMAILTPPPASDGGAPLDDDRYTADLPTLPFLNPQPWRMGDYLMLQRLAMTESSQVWRAEHKVHGAVAVKFITAATVATSAITEKRLTNEFALIRKLDHANIVRVWERGKHEGHTWISMGYAERGSLAELLASRPLHATGQPKEIDPRWAALVTQRIARALHYAYLNHILHRDVKPGNILIRHMSAADVLLSDFGIAYQTGDEHLTMHGAAVGTPAYMSPEQCQGQELDTRTDVYSLGCVLYEMLAGHPPFENDKPIAICYMHVHNPVPPIRQKFDPKLIAVLMRAMEKDRDHRYPTALDFAEALAPFVEVR